MARVTTLSSSQNVRENYSRIYTVSTANSQDMFSKFPEKGNVGIIVNTVNNAKEAYYAVKNRGYDVELFHSQFLIVDRLKNDQRLLQMVGKEAPPPNTVKVFIGTQLMEESLDIDFDVLFTSVCPMDKFLQRLGRVHRHSWKQRPHEYKTPHVYIFGEEDDLLPEESSYLIYGEFPIRQTRSILEERKKIDLPNDIDILLAAYAETRSPDLGEMHQKYLNEIDAKRKKAQTFLVRPPSSDRDGIFGWLSDGFSGKHADEQGAMQVRDGTSGIEVILVFIDETTGEQWVPVYKGNNRERLYLNGLSRWDEIHAIKNSSLTLPLKYNRYIDDIENLMPLDLFEMWKENHLLQGEIGIPCNDDSFTIGNTHITYDPSFGMKEIKT